MTRARRKIAKPLRGAYELLLGSLGQRPEVSGVDVGYKYEDGERTRKLAVRVHVLKKRPRRGLAETERVPRHVQGVPTDVVEARYRSQGSSAPPAWERHETLRPGVSVGNANTDTGTLGLVVFDNESGAPCILSAWHVLAGPFGAEGDAITQPARMDQGRLPRDIVARLHRFFPPGPWGDAAVAELTGRRPHEASQLSSGVRLARLDVPSLGQVLEKSGRTTGVTRGRVDGLGTYFYPNAPNGVAGFRLVPNGTDDPDRQDLSASGDSGAIWYDPGTRAGMGLHAAGETGKPAHEFAIACYLTRVMSALRVSLRPP